MKKDFTGFVLAGGKSSRMGADKFALLINGESFLERAVNTLKSVCETIKIVLNQSQSIETNLEIVRDIYENRGALGGIHAALKNCETNFAVILAVDLPLVTSKAVENLVHLAAVSNEFAAFVPQQSDERLQPLCAVYRVKDCLLALENILCESQNASARDFIETIAVRLIAQNRLSDDENLFFNVNYPLDFRQMIDKIVKL